MSEGRISITELDGIVIVDGYLSSSIEELEKFKESVRRKYPNKMIEFRIKHNEGVEILESSIEPNQERDLDKIGVVYYGYLPVEKIKTGKNFKHKDETNYLKLQNCYNVLDFIAPIVLDSDFYVVDGEYRLRLAREAGKKEVLCVVIDDNGVRADALRLILNRTSEFQIWDRYKTDDYVDAVPQSQPLMEPIGFFGKYVLPESFFTNSVIEYIIDPFNEQQKEYSQSQDLHEWANYRREQIERLNEEKYKKKKNLKTPVSLFDLIPKEEDFLETYNIEEAMKEVVDRAKEVAEEITQKSDEEAKEKLAKTGGAWQRSRRSSKAKVADSKNEFISEIASHPELSEDQKEEIIEMIKSGTSRREVEDRILEIEGGEPIE